MARDTETRSRKTKKRRRFKRPAENTTAAAGLLAVGGLLLGPDGKITPEMAAVVAGGIALVPKFVSEFVSWFRSSGEEDEEKPAVRREDRRPTDDERREDRRPTDDDRRAHRTSTDGELELRDRLARVETSIDGLKDRFNDRIGDLRDEVRAYRVNGEAPTKGSSGAKTTRAKTTRSRSTR